MDFTDGSAASAVDFDGDDCYGRGKSKLINNKIHLEFHDEYEHNCTYSKKLDYIIENILMERPLSSSSAIEQDSYTKLSNLYNSYYSMGCNCGNGNSTISNCIHECSNLEDYCVHGGNYASSTELATKLKDDRRQGKTELVLNENRRSMDLVYECSDKCLCSMVCHNRLIQYGPRNNLIIIDVSHLNKQLGLATTTSIPKGAFVCEYVGEILTKEEAQKRHEQNSIQNCMNYIICLNEYPLVNIANECGTIGLGDGKQHHQQQQHHHRLQQKKGDDNDDDNDCIIDEGVGKHLQTFIDPSQKGNIGRYLNHSCDPNCEILSIRIDGPIPRLGK